MKKGILFMVALMVVGLCFPTITTYAKSNDLVYEVTLTKGDLTSQNVDVDNYLGDVKTLDKNKWQFSNLKAGKSTIEVSKDRGYLKLKNSVKLNKKGFATISLEGKKEMKISSSDKDVISVKKNNNKFTIKCKKKGKTVLTFKLYGLEYKAKVEIK